MLIVSYCTVKDKCTGCSFYFDMLTSLGTDFDPRWVVPESTTTSYEGLHEITFQRMPEILVASHFIRGRGCWSCRLRDGVSLGGAPRSCHLSFAEAPAPGRFGTEPSLPKKLVAVRTLLLCTAPEKRESVGWKEFFFKLNAKKCQEYSIVIEFVAILASTR